jgi:hypothetical protein
MGAGGGSAGTAAFAGALAMVLQEAFERGGAMFLDEGAALLPTLAGLSAEDASRPIAPGASTIAAQADHLATTLEATLAALAGEPADDVDWDAAWRVTAVDDEAWTAIRDRVGGAYDTLMMVATDPATWPGPEAMAGGITAVAHVAYHLGEIRRSLAVLRPAG